ncbi:MAG: putative SAM-dependent methyltransferase [Magnetococcales bacterium]|nr:putative SAM-dependent methyltransferase [Magnetococcales bacterium]HIJ84172.1 class I SAM-dependent methyltransferase [Magnetococcales bacterium]
MARYYPPRFLFRRHEILRRVRSGRRFLEVGAGALRLARDLVGFFSSGVLLEPAPQAKQLWLSLPENIRERLDLQLTSLESFATSELFDCVISCEVMEHVSDDLSFAQRLHELLRPGGQLILSVPAGMRYWSLGDRVAGHLRRYEKEGLTHLLSQAGFSDIQIIGYGFPFVNLLRIPSWLHALMNRHVLEQGDPAQLTRESGINLIAGLPSWLGLFVNPITVWPFCRVAALFNTFHLSDGFLVVAIKPG